MNAFILTRLLNHLNPMKPHFCHHPKDVHLLRAGIVPKMIWILCTLWFLSGFESKSWKSWWYLKFDRDSILAGLKPEEVGPQQWRCQSYPPRHWQCLITQMSKYFRMLREDTDTNLQCTTIGSVLALIISLKNRTNLNMKIKLNSWFSILLLDQGVWRLRHPSIRPSCEKYITGPISIKEKDHLAG